MERRTHHPQNTRVILSVHHFLHPMTDKISAALLWITNFLKNLDIPFQITGGLAAHSYGARRPIFDIDIDIPEDAFELVKNNVSEFIIFGPEQFKSTEWDLLLMTLDYHGQLIDLGGAYHTKIFNKNTQCWEALKEDLSKATIRNVLGLMLPVIPKNHLVTYKKTLSRPEDLADLQYISKKG